MRGRRSGRPLPRTDHTHSRAVGSIQSNTRTLYIGGLQRTEGQDLQEVVTRHFEEWGEVEVGVFAPSLLLAAGRSALT